MDLSSWVLLILSAQIVAVAGFLIYCFAKADGDLTLLSRGPVPPGTFEDKVVWITGASEGIGEALANEFAGLGAKLILSSRRVVELQRVKDGLSGKNAPHGVVVLPLDLSAGTDAIVEAVRQAESAFDGIGVDYMVHNAAYPRPKLPALEISDEILKGTFEINTLATITLTRILAPEMIRRGRGHFVLISSVAGMVPAPGQAVYAASKHAVTGYFRSLQYELVDQGIKVTIVCPGPIASASKLKETPASEDKENRMTVERCAELAAIAAAHNLEVAWISNHPVLLLLYLCQYFPSIAAMLFRKIGPKRIAVSKGEDGGLFYSTSLLFSKSRKKKA